MPYIPKTLKIKKDRKVSFNFLTWKFFLMILMQKWIHKPYINKLRYDVPWFLVWAHLRKWAQKPDVGPNRKWAQTRRGPKPEVGLKTWSWDQIGIHAYFLILKWGQIIKKYILFLGPLPQVGSNQKSGSKKSPKNATNHPVVIVAW